MPFALIVFLFHIPTLLNVAKANFAIAGAFLAIIFVLFFWGAIAAQTDRDFIFFVKQVFKIVTGVLAGVIVAKYVLRRPLAIKFWTAAQVFLVALSMINSGVYSFLLQFSSPSSQATWSNLFSLRAAGFGLYHVDGSITLALIILLPSILNLSTYKFGLPQLSLGLLFSMTISRTAMVPIAIILMARKIGGFAVVLSLLFLATPFLQPEHGAVYQVVEIVRNFFETGSFSTKSTDANLHMIISPDYPLGWIYGEGYFFEPNSSAFYKYTDLGWIRLLLFGGLTATTLFALANTFFLLSAAKTGAISKLSFTALIVVFFIVNFKGIVVFSFFSTLVFLISKRKTDIQLKDRTQEP